MKFKHHRSQKLYGIRKAVKRYELSHFEESFGGQTKIDDDSGYPCTVTAD